MAIHLQEQEKLLSLLPGMYHTSISELYTASVLGIRNDSTAVIYSDQFPDSGNEGDYLYKIKKIIDLSKVSLVVVEEIEYRISFSYCFRISFLSKEEDNKLEFFYKKEDKNYLNNVVKSLKKLKLKVKKKTTLFE